MNKSYTILYIVIYMKIIYMIFMLDFKGEKYKVMQFNKSNVVCTIHENK